MTRFGRADSAERSTGSTVAAAARAVLRPAQAHVQAGGGACLAAPGLDKVTDLVDQPQAVTAQQLIGAGPVPGERISDVPGIRYLADDLFAGSPHLHRSAAAGMTQGIGGELADGDHQVGNARRREPGPLGPAGDKAADLAQVVTVAQRLGVSGRAGQRPITSRRNPAGRVASTLDEIRRLVSERSVFRGQVIAVGAWLEPKLGGQVPVTFLDRPAVGRSDVILPDGVLDAIERQVLGVARHAGRLRASGQHLKRGVLLHGPPGTGKTHTVRYLLGQMDGVTAILLSGGALSRIREACSVARALQPSVVVVEDVDLIGEERLPRMGPVIGHHPLLFQLLSEMDGLDSDIDVTFLLTTNRPEILEPALAARPGRVDLAAELPLPDADARRRLVRAPRMNAICERLVSTLRREVLDRTLILDEAHLRAVLTEYQTHYNTARPHQGIAQHVPGSDRHIPRAAVTDPGTVRIHRRPVLGGLINEHTHAA